MQFLANENIPLPSVKLLRQAGYEVASITEDSPRVDDRAVLSRTATERRIILTFDRDYGELIYRLRLPSPAGIIYFRFRPRTPNESATFLLDLLQIQDLKFEEKFTVIEREQIRQRPLP